MTQGKSSIRTSLAQKVLLPTVIVGLALCFGVLFTFYQYAKKTELKRLFEQFRLSLFTVEELAATAGGPNLSPRFVDFVAVEPNVDAILLIDRESLRVLFSSRHDWIGLSINDLPSKEIEMAVLAFLSNENRQAIHLEETDLGNYIFLGQLSERSALFLQRISEPEVSPGFWKVAAWVLFVFGCAMALTQLAFVHFIHIPIQQIIEVIRQRTWGNKEARVGGDRRDEIGQVAVVLNQLFDNEDKVDREIREGEERVKLALESVSDGVWDWLDMARAKQFWSPHFLTFMGLEGENPYRKIIDEDRRQLSERILNLTLEEPELDMRVQMRNGAGELRWIEIKGQMIVSSSSSRLICALRDITRDIAVEGEVRQYTKKLEDSHRELEELTFMACHDLREPIRGMNNLATFLLTDEKERLSERGQERLESINSLAKSMYALLETLLNYSTARNLDAVCKPVHVGVLLDKALSELSPLIEDRRVDIRIKGPFPYIDCDAHRLREVLVNLIGNAVRYNDKSTPWVEIGMAPPEDHSEVIFYIKDNGVGIQEADQEKIFHFHQRLNTNRHLRGGLGIGLALVKRIVEKHQGRIWLSSELGVGSIFYFSMKKARS